MARPVKGKKQKEIQGTLRQRKGVISLNLQPLKEMPTAPGEFDADERWFFNMACEALFNSNLLRAPDLMTIESMAGWWAIMKKAQKDIRDNGYVQVAERTGWQNVSPAVQIFEKAWNKLKDFSDRYGFNLLSKDKINVPLGNDGDDEWLNKHLAR